jgi:rSAM/selenodomain-associated transferase 1
MLARWPAPGRGKRRLAAAVGDDEAARLALAFLRDAARAVVTAELWRPVLFVEPSSAVVEAAARTGITEARAQGDGHIGLRMLDAARALEGEGHSPLLLVGADLPLLAPRHLHHALRALRRADVVFGPVEDGGYYLVGMHRVQPALFDDPSLSAVWGGPGVLDASERLARSLGLSTARIAPELDVDTAADLDRLLERLAALEPGDRPRHTAAALGFESARGAADGTEAGARSGGTP